jgi:hypothetical protein
MKKRNLIKRYVEGWKRGSGEIILDTVTPDCIIVESDGSVYRGSQAIAHWIKNWKQERNMVAVWDIAAYYEMSDTAFFEWTFACVAKGRHYQFNGMSIVKFEKDKISYLREYKTTKSLHEI